jgi:hypothetical protein
MNQERSVKNYTALFERYPEFYFQLAWNEEVSQLSAEELSAIHPAGEIERFFQNVQLEEIEVLYIYGIGLGLHVNSLKGWLEANPRRKIVYLEDDLHAIAVAAQFGDEAVFADPQVFIRCIASPRQWTSLMKACALEFPTRRLEMCSIERYARKKRIGQLRLRMLRQSGLVETCFQEAIHAHMIHRNLLDNLKQLEGSFDAHGLTKQFRGIPAVICGAGPSLEESVELLKELEDRMLILAGGSAIPALGHFGVTPHLALAIDPNRAEVECFEASLIQEVPLLFGCRVHPEIFSTFNAPLGYIQTNTAGSAESWLRERVGLNDEIFCHALGHEALSISTLTLALAVAMGCDPIICVGVDLAYTKMRRYASGVMGEREESIDHHIGEQLDTVIKKKNGNGDMVYTSVKWIMEADVFSKFAKQNAERRFFRVGREGLPINHIPSADLEELAHRFSTSRHDFLGEIHRLVQASQFVGLGAGQIEQMKEELLRSVARCEQLCLEALEELSGLQSPAIFPTGRLIALTMAFEEEPAHACLFESVGSAFERRGQNERNIPLLSLELQRDKWQHLLTVTQFYLPLLK